MTSPTLQVNLVNAWPTTGVYAFITGLALDNNNALFLLQSDGHTPYYPTSPSSIGSPLQANCAIALGDPGSTTTVTIPHLAGARIWFSIGQPLVFLLNPGPALVEPSVSNPSDPSIGIEWDFAELTYNSAQLFANITYVDFVCLPISLTLTSKNGGAAQHVSGMPHGSRGTICDSLKAQSAADGEQGWASLVVPGKNTEQGAYLRALSPNNGIVTSGGQAFRGYYEPYVQQVWQKYTGTGLSVDTQAQWGDVQAQVNGGNNLLTFPSGITYAQPSTADIFSCSSGSFAASSNIEQGAITARLAAAFNRSTLLETNEVPGNGGYYQNAITNHYSRIVHQTNLDGRGYA